MSTIRYTAGGSYDPGNSAGATTSSGIDFSDQAYRGVGVSNGFDEYYVSSSSSGSLLRTADGSSLLLPSTSGIGVDFSDKTGFVYLSGGGLGDSLRSGSNGDTLEGGGGNDVLEAGLGNNTLDGGTGINTISYEHLSQSLNAGVAVYLNNGYAYDLIDASRLVDSFTNIQNVTGSAWGDLLIGSSGNNVFEGGAGADTIQGNGGTDTASYGGSTAVNVDLTTNVNTGGDAEGDDLDGIANILGSTFADTLTGDALANTLTGNGGGDALYGMGGNDRLVISDTPIMIDGGAGKDYLFVQGGGSVALTETAFTGIENVYVRNDTTLDMSGVSTGVTIISQSTDQHIVDITGTSGDDAIKAGKGFDQIHGGAGDDVIKGGNGNGPASAGLFYGDAGNDVITAGDGIAYIFGGDGNDTLKGASGVGLLSGGDGNDRIIAGARGFDIDGGEGADKLFASSGDDTFHSQAGFGRDNVYGFNTATDSITVDIAGLDASDIKLTAFHGGQDTIVTFAGLESGNKIILHDVTIADIQAGHSDLFTFGA